MLRQKKFTDLIGQLASKNYKSHDLELQKNNRPSFKNYDEYLTQLVANLGGRTGLIYDLVLKEPIRETHIDISSETRSRKTVVATISSQISIGQNPSPTASPQVTSANDGAASGTYKELTVDQEPYSGSANNDLYLSYEPDNYCIVRANENISDDAWQKARLFELDAALAGHNELDKPDIITFGELAYPPPRTNSASKE